MPNFNVNLKATMAAIRSFLTITFLFLACFCHAATDLSIDLTNPNIGITPYTNRTIWVTRASPFPGNKQIFVTDTSGQYTYTNIPAGLYSISVKAPPSATDFMVLVSSTNLGDISAGDYLVAASTATFPAGAVAWSAAVTDSRYSRNSNALASISSTTSGLTVTGGSNAVLSQVVLTITNLSQAQISNLVSDLAALYPTSNPAFYVTSNQLWISSNSLYNAIQSNGGASTNFVNSLVEASSNALVSLVASSSNAVAGLIVGASNNLVTLVSSSSNAVMANLSDTNTALTSLIASSSNAAAQVAVNGTNALNALISAKQTGSHILTNLVNLGITNIIAGTNAVIYTNNGVLVVNGTGTGGGGGNPDAITNGQNNILLANVGLTNGTITFSNMSINGVTFALFSTNVLSVQGAATFAANGTYKFQTNANGPGWYLNIGNQTVRATNIAGIWYIINSGVIQYSSEHLITNTWTQVNGASPTPSSAYGMTLNMDPVDWHGYIASTNITERIAGAVNSSSNSLVSTINANGTVVSNGVLAAMTNALAASTNAFNANSFTTNNESAATRVATNISGSVLTNRLKPWLETVNTTNIWTNQYFRTVVITNRTLPSFVVLESIVIGGSTNACANGTYYWNPWVGALTNTCGYIFIPLVGNGQGSIGGTITNIAVVKSNIMVFGSSQVPGANNTYFFSYKTNNPPFDTGTNSFVFTNVNNAFFLESLYQGGLGSDTASWTLVTNRSATPPYVYSASAPGSYPVNGYNKNMTPNSASGGNVTDSPVVVWYTNLYFGAIPPQGFIPDEATFLDPSVGPLDYVVFAPINPSNYVAVVTYTNSALRWEPDLSQFRLCHGFFGGACDQSVLVNLRGRIVHGCDCKFISP